MIYKHSLTSGVSNLDLGLRMLIYVVLFMLILMAIFTAVAAPIYNSIGEKFDIINRMDNLHKRFASTRITIEGVDQVYEELGSFFKQDSQKIGAALGIYVTFFVLALFVASLMIVPITVILNQRMTIGYSTSLIKALISNLKKSFAFAVFNTVLGVIVNVALGVILYFITLSLYMGLKIIGLSIAVLIATFILGLKYSLISQWVPLIVLEKKGIFKSLFNSIKISRNLIAKLLPFFTFLMLVVFATSMATSVFTAYLMPILIFSFYIVLVVCANLISYYRTNKIKYMINEQTFTFDE